MLLIQLANNYNKLFNYGNAHKITNRKIRIHRPF